MALVQVRSGSSPSADRPPRVSILQESGQWLTADRAMSFLTRASAVGILLMLVSLVVVLVIHSMPSIREFGWSFVTGSNWRPNELEVPKRGPDGKIVIEDGEVVTEVIPPMFGALPVIYGTAVSSALALLFAVPLSLGAALFLVRIAPRWLVPPVSFLIEFLAAIPSIAYGIWGLFVMAPFLMGNRPVWGWMEWMDRVPGLTWFFDRVPNWHTLDANDTMVVFRGVEPLIKAVFEGVPGMKWLFQVTTESGVRDISLTGRDMFAGGLILGIMILPIITAVSRDVLRAVPRSQIEGSLALGATWWQSCREMLRFSRSALFGAVMLGLARAAGETMAVTMVIGNNNQIVPSPFAPAQTMSSLLANEFAEATGEMHRSGLTQVALILLAMSLFFNIVARSLVVGKNSRTAAAH